MLALSTLYHDFGERVALVYDGIYQKYGLIMRCTAAIRTKEEQALLYSQGRSTPGRIITKAQPGRSWHNYGLAADSCFQGQDPYLEKHAKGKEIWADFGKMCLNNHLNWGGFFSDFPDQPHCEKRYGFSLNEAERVLNAVGINGFWNELDQRLPDIAKQEIMH